MRPAAKKPRTSPPARPRRTPFAALVPAVPEIFGARPTWPAPNLTFVKGSKGVTRTEGGNYCYYGVREFAMTAIANVLRCTAAWFPTHRDLLVFSDYARNAIRMAALMKQRQIMVYTHDSIGLGEDGPTHQPVEHIPSMRIIPNLDVWRPADATETAIAWTAAVDRADGPSLLALSRQNLPTVTQKIADADIRKGGYVLSDMADAKAVLIATGSEVKTGTRHPGRTGCRRYCNARRLDALHQCLRPSGQGLPHVRLGAHVPRVAIEAAHPDFWHKYVGLHGAVVGIDRFGESAPGRPAVRMFRFHCRQRRQHDQGAAVLITD